jgi:hypothetical protein
MMFANLDLRRLRSALSNLSAKTGCAREGVCWASACTSVPPRLRKLFLYSLSARKK